MTDELKVNDVVILPCGKVGKIKEVVTLASGTTHCVIYGNYWYEDMNVYDAKDLKKITIETEFEQIMYDLPKT